MPTKQALRRLRRGCSGHANIKVLILMMQSNFRARNGSCTVDFRCFNQWFASFEGLRASQSVKNSSFSPVRTFRPLVVKAATTVAPKYTSLKPLGDRLLVKIKMAEEKTTGGILLPTVAQSKPQGGEVVVVGEGLTVGKNKVDISVQVSSQFILILSFMFFNVMIVWLTRMYLFVDWCPSGVLKVCRNRSGVQRNKSSHFEGG
ncbi:hypothetical protein ACS0TY_020539 [Phlomoides rotata]